MPFSTRYPDLFLHMQFTPFEKKSISEDMQEAHQWKSTLALDQIQALYVYGLGNHATLLLDWLKEDPGRHLIFLEDDLAALDAFSKLPQAKEILDHPQIHLRFATKPWDMLLEECAAEFSFDKIEVSALKKSDRFKKIKLSLLRKTVLWNALTTETILSHQLHDNIIPNLRRIPECSYINQWKDALKGVPIIICGAGPSLKLIAEDLRKARDHAVIIACGSALSALSHLKIRPHLGIAIDPNERELHCLSGCGYRDLPLLFGSRLYPRVFELFDGPYGYIRSGTGGSLESHVEQELGLNEPYLGYDLGREALSVTTLALSLAHFWGCNQIIFAGVDMAYAKEAVVKLSATEKSMILSQFAEAAMRPELHCGAHTQESRAPQWGDKMAQKGDFAVVESFTTASKEKHYADGVPVNAQLNTKEKRSSDQMIRRKGAEGHMVSTLIKWIMERDTIDRYAKNHPETTFLNASPGGLGFKHIPHKPLLEMGQASCNYDEKIRQLFQQTKIQKSADEIDQIFASLSQSLERCLEYFKLLQQEEPESGKSVLYQTDLETEIAYQLVLGSSKRALDRMGQKMEKEKWKFLEEATLAYLKALKGKGEILCSYGN